MTEPDTRRAWSLLTVTERGVVSVVRDLTLEEVKATYKRLAPNYGAKIVTYLNKDGGATSEWHDGQFNGPRMSVREVFGPPGWDASEVSSWDEPIEREEIPWDDERNRLRLAMLERERRDQQTPSPKEQRKPWWAV